MKKLIKSIAVLSLVVLLIAGGCAAYLYNRITGFATQPAGKEATRQLFVIQPGQTLSTISRQLESQGLITNQTDFKLLVRFRKAATRLQAGEYVLSAGSSPDQILKTLLQGRVHLHRVTIPEGFSMKEIARLMEVKQLCTSKQFLDLCRDKTVIQSMNIPAVTLEGYLFPDTYFFPKGSSCTEIIFAMTRKFHSIYTDEYKKRTKELGFTTHEILTLASIIEKETGDPDERPLISSVFHNRLKKNMRLESDPTVIYGIKDYDGNIKKKHLKELTPYNTYRIKGLPPGPIASPGAESIKAALFPEKSDYFYFVAKGDTTHYFSKTITEHNRAVRKYQLKKR